jgi:hypothetical protein
MKVALLALVLLAASVIVLIFANTLNSWVLGGMIGGLAALLISIPVSLVIFTSLARRHDERLFAQLAEEEANAYGAVDEESAVYEADAYVYPQEGDEYYQDETFYEDEYSQQDGDPRLYRAPEARRLPSPDQTRQYTQPTRSPYTRRDGQRTGHQRQARSPQITRSLLSTSHTAALRAAVREAKQDHLDQDEVSFSRRRTVTPRRPLPSREKSFRPEEQRPFPSTDKLKTRQPAPPDNANRTQQAYQRRTGDLYTSDVRDEQEPYYPNTSPLPHNPETGQIMRSPQPAEEHNPSERWTGALNNPVVRRAPYLYEDDPLHEHFAQQVEKPIARRSSRYLQPQQEE